MDISDTLAPNSDQLDAIELVSGPRVFTIAEVTKGSNEQPVNVNFTDFPRPWRPSKGMRRVLAACWGADASAWVGRRVQLYLDPDVTFGKEKPGGTRIAALSHIDKPKQVPLLVSRGKSAVFVVKPLPDDAPPRAAASPAVSEETLAVLTDTLARKGIPEGAWLSGANHITGGSATALDTLTEDEARRVLAALEQRPDAGGSDE